MQSYLPELNEEGLIRAEPVAVLNRKLGKKENHVVI